MKSRFLKPAILIIPAILLFSSCEEPEPEITFPDPVFEAVIREALDMPSGNITHEDVLAITELSAVGVWEGITDITGIEYCTNLTDLSLYYHQIADISSLSGLTNLSALVLHGNQIVDISPLSGLTNLTELYLGDNQIVDISSLSGLTNLDTLNLNYNQIVDISQLSGLANLAWLEILSNQIGDILPLVQNMGINQGDFVSLKSNPLSQASINTYIPQLEARGVEVYY